LIERKKREKWKVGEEGRSEGKEGRGEEREGGIFAHNSV